MADHDAQVGGRLRVNVVDPMLYCATTRSRCDTWMMRRVIGAWRGGG